MRKLFIVLGVLFVLMSCTTEKQAGVSDRKAAESGNAVNSQSPASGAAVYSLEITPKNAVRSSILSLMPTGFALADARVEWIVNGRPFEGGAAHQLYSTDLWKGDTIQARAFVKGIEIRSGQITITNAPPEISRVKIIPEVLKPGDTLGIEAEGKDIDGDSVSFLYEWTRNGESAGKSSRIETPLKRGDKVSVRVTPFDGENYGSPVVINREIGNMPPVIVENKELTFDGSACAYQVKATDPDSDALSYSLEKAPSGMSIDKSTGLIKWPVPSDFKGETDVLVIVNDGHGGSAQCTQKITIK